MENPACSTGVFYFLFFFIGSHQGQFSTNTHAELSFSAKTLTGTGKMRRARNLAKAPNSNGHRSATVMAQSLEFRNVTVSVSLCFSLSGRRAPARVAGFSAWWTPPGCCAYAARANLRSSVWRKRNACFNSWLTWIQACWGNNWMNTALIQQPGQLRGEKYVVPCVKRTPVFFTQMLLRNY